MFLLAAKLFAWLLFATLLGFMWAWIWRGAKDKNRFDHFFREWRLRYAQMEQDYTAQLAETEHLKERLAQYESTRAEQPNPASLDAEDENNAVSPHDHEPPYPQQHHALG
jgi:hypothetical protein